MIIWDHGEEKLDELLGYLNVHEERIQFTIEKEVDGVLPFLDLSIKRESNWLTTKVYRKIRIHFDIYIGDPTILKKSYWV